MLQVFVGQGHDGHAQAHRGHVRQGLLAVQFHLLADRQLLLAQLLLDDASGPGTFVKAQEWLAGE
ncbi:hypothetical protein D3C76_1329100 [compost metagenome]